VIASSAPAGNWKPYGVPETVSLLPPSTAKQQFPLWNVARTGMPPALYASRNASRCVVKSAELMSCQPPVCAMVKSCTAKVGTPTTSLVGGATTLNHTAGLWLVAHAAFSLKVCASLNTGTR
jgi:hypothetical protein